MGKEGEAEILVTVCNNTDTIYKYIQEPATNEHTVLVARVCTLAL